MSHIKIVVLIDTDCDRGRAMLDELGTHGLASMAMADARLDIEEGTTAKGGTLSIRGDVYGRWDWSQVL